LLDLCASNKSDSSASVASSEASSVESQTVNNNNNNNNRILGFSIASSVCSIDENNEDGDTIAGVVSPAAAPAAPVAALSTGDSSGDGWVYPKSKAHQRYIVSLMKMIGIAHDCYHSGN
jgi:hypothetical protein